MSWKTRRSFGFEETQFVVSFVFNTWKSPNGRIRLVHHSSVSFDRLGPAKIFRKLMKKRRGFEDVVIRKHVEFRTKDLKTERVRG